jgi:hypothetical protein
LGEHFSGLSVAERHACEVQLVEKGRIERDELLTFQAVHHMTGSGVEVERFQLLRDGV